MGRVKLKIERLESSSNRLASYSKRKGGLIKKAHELSVLCDVELLLLLFSPSGKPIVWAGNNSIEGIIGRFAELSAHERVKRKFQSFDGLKRAYKNSDHKVSGQDLFGSSYRTPEDLTTLINVSRARLSEVQQRLSEWNNPDEINSIQLLVQMEEYVKKLLGEVQTQKANIGNQQTLALGCHYQFQNEAHLPFNLVADPHRQQVQHLSWLNQHMVSPEETNLLSNRQESSLLDELCRTESLRDELTRLRNELTRAENSQNELVRAESSRINLMNSECLTNELVQKQCLMNDLKRTESCRNNLITVETSTNEPQYDFTFQPAQQMNELSVDDFCDEGNFLCSQLGFGSIHCNWASPSGPSGIVAFDEHPFSQQQYAADFAIAEVNR